MLLPFGRAARWHAVNSSSAQRALIRHSIIAGQPVTRCGYTAHSSATCETLDVSSQEETCGAACCAERAPATVRGRFFAYLPLTAIPALRASSTHISAPSPIYQYRSSAEEGLCGGRRIYADSVIRNYHRPFYLQHSCGSMQTMPEGQDCLPHIPPSLIQQRYSRFDGIHPMTHNATRWRYRKPSIC